MSPLPETDDNSFTLCTSKGSCAIRPVHWKTPAKANAKFSKLVFKSEYTAELTMPQAYHTLMTLEVLSLDLSVRLLLAYIETIPLPSPLSLGDQLLTSPSLGNPSVHHMLIKNICDLTCGTKLLTTQVERIGPDELYFAVGLLLISNRLTTYDKGNFEKLRSELKSKVFAVFRQNKRDVGTNLGKILSGDCYFHSLMNSSSLSYMASLYDFIFLKNPTLKISKLRICTVNNYHRDSIILLKLQQLFSIENVDRDFVLKSMPILWNLRHENSIINCEGSQAFVENSPIIYMRACNWVSRSAFSAVSMPNTNFYISVLLALFGEKGLFHTIIHDVPNVTTLIALAYLVYKEHIKSQCSKAHETFENANAATSGVTKIQNTVQAKARIIDRTKKSVIKLEGQELTELKRISARFSDRANTIGAYIKNMQ